MKINYQLLKDFLKPDWRKVAISIIFTHFSFGFLMIQHIPGSLFWKWVEYLFINFPLFLCAGLTTSIGWLLFSIIFMTSYIASCFIIYTFPSISWRKLLLIFIIGSVLPLPFLIVKEFTQPPEKVTMSYAECELAALQYCASWASCNYSKICKPEKPFLELYPPCRFWNFSHHINESFCREHYPI